MIVREVMTVCPTPLMNKTRGLDIVMEIEGVAEGAGEDCDMIFRRVRRVA